ncbi:MAG: hypothetical protein P8M53_06710 [Pirellulales bacterium]|nr:hypothetical protein [Pirellulales bacterium]
MVTPQERGHLISIFTSQTGVIAIDKDGSLSNKEIRLVTLVQVSLYMLKARISAVIGQKTPGSQRPLAV